MTVKLVKDKDYVIVETGSVGEKRWKAKGYKPEKSEGDNGKPESDKTGTGNKSGKDEGKPDTGQEGLEQTGSENNKSGSKATDGNDTK
ncbi:MAG: hypothetical protein PF637_06005 [Spirochaetes bacterium]|nr:hypothetical protein [Spirochaetota bacterium]